MFTVDGQRQDDLCAMETIGGKKQCTLFDVVNQRLALCALWFKGDTE